MYKKDDGFRLFVHLKMFKRDKNCVRFVSSLRCANEISKEKKNQQKKEKGKGICGHVRYIYISLLFIQNTSPF